MGDLLLGQKGREQFRFLHAGGAHQHRPAFLVNGGRFIGHGLPFGRLGFVDLVGPIGAGAHPVGGHDRDLELVGLLEFDLLGFGRTGHAGQAWIEQEEVLVGDRGEGLGFRLDRQLFLGLNGLVLAITPATAWHHPASEFIHDHRISAAHDVVDVFGEKLLGLEGIVDVVGPGIFGVEQIGHTQHLLSLAIALIGEGHVALLLINFVVALGVNAVFTHLIGPFQLGCHFRGPAVLLLGPLHLA